LFICLEEALLGSLQF